MALTKVITGVTDLNQAQSTNGLKFPTGNAFAGTPEEGMIRNDQSQASEGSASTMQFYNGTAWKNFVNVGLPLANASFILDPKTITSDGSISSWVDTGSIGRNFALANYSKAGTGGSIEYVTSSYGSGRTAFAGSSSTSSTDYSTQQDFTIGTFMNVSSSYQTAIAYPYGIRMGPAYGGASDYASEFVQFAARYGWGGGLDYYSYSSFREGTTNRAGGYTLSQQPYPSWKFICHTVNWSTKTVKMYFNGAKITTVVGSGTPGSTTNILSLGNGYTASEANGGVSLGISFGFMGTEKSESDITAIWNYYKGDYGL